MKISTKGRYALNAVLYLAEKGGPVNIRGAVEGTGVSEKYLEQLFFLLRKEGILDTMRGPRGGYFIAQDIDQLTAGDVVRAVEGELVPVPCVKDLCNCTSNMQENCLTKDLWKKVSDIMYSVLDTTTIEKLLKELNELKTSKLEKTEYFI
jgi:Rrf2 family protein